MHGSGIALLRLAHPPQHTAPHRNSTRLRAASYFSCVADELVAIDDFAYQIAKTGRSMSDDEVVTNLLTFIAGGHETTAVALTWTLWLLAKDQATQQRVFDEVRAVTGDRLIDATHVEGLSFCRQVIQEAMRLFPPAPGIARIAKEAVELGGMPIPARTRIHIPVFALHRNVGLWDNPNAFDPDRFAA